jgi:hypothetical protein
MTMRVAPRTLHLALALIGLLSSAGSAERPRLLVLTDMGGDPDDRQSMIRLMLYSNEFEIEGLVASAAGTPGELKERTTRPDLIREIVEAYASVRRNLAVHAQGYPSAETLFSRIKPGNPNRGIEAVGEGKDTEASRWIIASADRNDPRPLNISIWGGQTDLAQALWRVRHDRGPAGLARFVSRLRVYDISDQDGIVSWMWAQFPGMFYILSKAPEGQDRRLGGYRGMYLGGDESLTSRAWLEVNVLSGHGPLGALYPMATWTDPNPHKALKEGDTPSWFYFLPHGLNDPEHPEWGGWGGRFAPAGANVFRDAQDTFDGVADARVTVSRWRAAWQSDFAARLDWGISETYAAANHAPIAIINGDDSHNVVRVNARSGDTVHLSAEGSRDPDRNVLRFRWSIYPEPGTYKGTLVLEGAESNVVSFTAPRVAEPQTIHIVLSMSDSGQPGLVVYRRAVVTIRPG